jgi:hypothetical protein
MKLVKGLLVLLFACGVVVAEQPMPKDKCGCQKPKPTNVMPAKPRKA